MQIINYFLEGSIHKGLSLLLDGTVEKGTYTGDANLHAIALLGVTLGDSLDIITQNATLSPFAVDTFCRGATVVEVIGEITPQAFPLILERSEGPL